MKFLQTSSIISFSILLMACFSFTETKEVAEKQYQPNATTEVAYFASGCFWCVEAVFESVKGVEEAVSGYAGGFTDNPTYQSIGTGKTGHAEAVAVYYNPAEVSFETLVTVFFGSHDPTTVNGQKPEELIPQEAISVFSLNNINLLQKISLDELVQYEFMEEVQQEIFDGSTAQKTIKDAGIDFNQKLNVFVGRTANYDITGLTFGIKNRKDFFTVFDDFESTKSNYQGVDFYTSYFNRIAISGNIGILYRVTPNIEIVDKITDSIWYARGNEYPFYNYWDDYDYRYDDEEYIEYEGEEYYEEEEIEYLEEEEYNLTDEMEIEENTSAPKLFDEMPEATDDPNTKNYYELRDSIDMVLQELYLVEFSNELFINKNNLIKKYEGFNSTMIAGAKTISFNPNSNLFMIISNNHINGKNDPIFVSEQEFLSKNVKIFDLLRSTNNFKYLFFFALVPFIIFLVFLKNSDNIKDKILKNRDNIRQQLNLYENRILDELLEDENSSLENGLIDLSVKDKLISDLFSVHIQLDKVIYFLDNLKDGNINIYNKNMLIDHPGSWQQFQYRPDKKNLSVMEMKSKYLHEQYLFEAQMNTLNQIHQQKCSAAIFCRIGWKAPNVAKANGRPRSSHKKAESRRKFAAQTRHIIILLHASTANAAVLLQLFCK